MQTQSIVKTKQGKKIMARLARHWRHKCEVALNENDALIQLPFGPCQLTADGQTMTMVVDVRDDWPIERAEKMVASHVVRMAQKEAVRVSWERQVAE